jgi:insertion element IS1 protein InsB
MNEKKEPELQHVHVAVCHEIRAEAVAVEGHKVESAELDEMWSLVGKKAQQRWLGHAIDHLNGMVLAYVCGTREDEVF